VCLLHVDEKVEFHPPDSLQPNQGALPDLKLVAQPPLQLLAALSSLAILGIIGPCAADGVCAVDDGV
jgi:hypothetical protein